MLFLYGGNMIKETETRTRILKVKPRWKCNYFQSIGRILNNVALFLLFKEIPKLMIFICKL